jgi:hypothetical protein
MPQKTKKRERGRGRGGEREGGYEHKALITKTITLSFKSGTLRFIETIL